MSTLLLHEKSFLPDLTAAKTENVVIGPGNMSCNLCHAQGEMEQRYTVRAANCEHTLPLSKVQFTVEPNSLEIETRAHWAILRNTKKARVPLQNVRISATTLLAFCGKKFKQTILEGPLHEEIILLQKQIKEYHESGSSTLTP